MPPHSTRAERRKPPLPFLEATTSPIQPQSRWQAKYQSAFCQPTTPHVPDTAAAWSLLHIGGAARCPGHASVASLGSRCPLLRSLTTKDLSLYGASRLWVLILVSPQHGLAHSDSHTGHRSSAARAQILPVVHQGGEGYPQATIPIGGTASGTPCERCPFLPARHSFSTFCLP